MTAATVLFWLSLVTLWYAYVGFPLLLVGFRMVRGTRPVRQGMATPRASLLIAAHNEEHGIAARLDNALAMDYPHAALEIIVASDGSSDATEDIVMRYVPRNVHLLRLQRCGKSAALDAAARIATGEIFVFSDANTFCEPHALKALVRNFTDPDVGGVAGHTGYRIRPGSESSSLGERLYWRYDTWLKEQESRTASVVSAHGGLYALRRELYSPPADASVTDDFTISTGVIAAGRRLVFERAARAWEEAPPRAHQEFNRRVRLMTRGLRAIALRRELLNPFRYGAYAVFLFSHKVVRRLVPLVLLGLLAGAFAASGAGPPYRIALGAQLAFYLLAGAGWLARSSPIGRARALYVPFFYCMANLAALVALSRFLRGERIALWQPQRQAGGA